MQTVFPDIILPLHGLNYDGLSDYDFFEFCSNNTQSRIERDSNRQIILLPPAGALTASFNIRLATQLELWNQKEKSGITFDSSAGFTLPDDSVFSPDASWMHKEKWERVPREDKKKICPRLPGFCN